MAALWLAPWGWWRAPITAAPETAKDPSQVLSTQHVGARAGGGEKASRGGGAPAYAAAAPLELQSDALKRSAAAAAQAALPRCQIIQ